MQSSEILTELVQQIHSTHTVDYEGTLYLNSCILDDIAGVKLPEKKRLLEPVITSILQGTSIKQDEVLRTVTVGHRQKYVVVKFNIMQIIIVRGFNKLPWTDLRRAYVSHFFSPALVPDFTETIPSRTPTDSISKQVTDSSKFWEEVTKVADRNNINLEPLAVKFLEDARKRNDARKKRSTDQNHIKDLVASIFQNWNFDRLVESIFLATKTENWQSILNIIRDHLSVPGVKPGLVPSVTTIFRTGQDLMQIFMKMCRPEQTFSGFRVDLVKAVQIASFMLLGTAKLSGLSVDIWGDGVEIGKVDITRMAFRILNKDFSAQSSKYVFTFAAFRGHDSRYNLELNIGWTTLGQQQTSWLYQQTNHLASEGVHITYSGDQPFMLRLFMGICTDHANFPSKMPMYLKPELEKEHSESLVDKVTKRRLDLQTPFRTDLPLESLTYVKDIRCICPDATHAIIRCVESDLRKWVDLILSYKKTEALKTQAYSTLEHNLTEREVKLPAFKFSFHPRSKSCMTVSLSGKEALSAIAERDGLEETGRVSCDLFGGVWSDEELLSGNENVDCVRVLKEMHPQLFCHADPVRKTAEKYISLKDASELWRKSLNALTWFLRKSKDNFKIDDFKFWAETYYQLSLAVFPLSVALTPYKLKLLLIPELVESGNICTPWNHMTESLEKSNHHSNKDFHLRTMRGGGNIHNHDPLFLDLYFSFCRLLQLTKVETTLRALCNACYFTVYKQSITEGDIMSYQSICSKQPDDPQLPIGEKIPADRRLLGMRFYIAGTFDRTENTKKDDLEILVAQLGGTILSKSSAETLLKNHSRVPHCYIIVKNEKALIDATSYYDPKSKKGKAELTGAAKNLKMFAGGKWKFLKKEFITDSGSADVVLNPDDYSIEPGENIRSIRVNDVRTLMRKQRGDIGATVSVITSIKKFHQNVEVMKRKRVCFSDSESGSETEGSLCGNSDTDEIIP